MFAWADWRKLAPIENGQIDSNSLAIRPKSYRNYQETAMRTLNLNLVSLTAALVLTALQLLVTGIVLAIGL